MNQAEKNAAVTAAPRPLTLGARTLLIAQATLSDVMAIGVEARRLLRDRETPLAALVNDPVFKQLPAACQVAATQEAVRAQLSGGGISSMDLAFEMGNPALLAFAVWALALRNSPGLTLEEIKRDITEDNAGEVLVRFVEASGLKDLPSPFASGQPG